MRKALLAGAAAVAAGSAAVAGCIAADAPAAVNAASATAETLRPQARCEAALAAEWPIADTRIERAVEVAAGTPISAGMAGEVIAPAHCEIIGTTPDRRGVDGQTYAIRFHLRLPEAWNGRFLFQGGGGTNGQLGDALGVTSQAVPSALAQGYAVLSQDSGHDNNRNSDPARGGVTSFGFDPQARADYGHASLAPMARTAGAVIEAYYGRPARHSYFAGCSKGGEEGMVLAQQHPELFDGIIAGAPGFSLPRAAVAEVWDVQALARAGGRDSPVLADLAASFSDADLALVGRAVLEACDRDDGLADGIVGAVGLCTTGRVRAPLAALACSGAKNASCLTTRQIDGLVKVMDGARRSDGTALYADWAWDPSIAAPGWRMWKLGSADGRMPALNVTLGGSSLPTVFSVPPTAVPADPAALFAWQMAFDFDRDAQRIYATGGGFTRSGWDDVSARSPDLSGLRAQGGRLLVWHGVADPVFSINDTLAWYREVEALEQGRADSFVRVFPVPGLAHCAGGAATGAFDPLGALVAWVEEERAPDRIIATAGPQTPWPGRTRPLCPFPKTARYRGGEGESADSFECS